jgi:hypothetical protein
MLSASSRNLRMPMLPERDRVCCLSQNGCGKRYAFGLFHVNSTKTDKGRRPSLSLETVRCHRFPGISFPGIVFPASFSRHHEHTHLTTHSQNDNNINRYHKKIEKIEKNNLQYT